MSSTNGGNGNGNSGIKIMECIYVMLESGCVINRLVIIGKQITVEFTMNDSAWTLSSTGRVTETAVNKLCEQLKSFNLISEDDWYHYKMQFYCQKQSPPSPPLQPPPSPPNAANAIIADNAVADPDPHHTHNKNIAIMTFILNAIVSGWRVRKSFSRGGEYRFNKSHRGKRKYLSAKFLSRFLEQNINIIR